MPSSLSEIEPAKFQSFDTETDPAQVAPRLAALRGEMRKLELDGFLIPLSDAHRGESLPACERRLAFVTGFTGSAGLALISPEKAALLVDGRYTLQAPAQTDTSLIDVLPLPQTHPADWLRETVPPNSRVGYNPWLHTLSEIRKWSRDLKDHAALVPTPDLVASIWPDRPAPPRGQVELLGDNRAGISAREKIRSLQRQLADRKADALVLNVPESICWLFNIRGRDVPNTPVVLSFAIIPAAGTPILFLDPDKLEPNQSKELSAIANIQPEDAFPKAVERLKSDGAAIWLDPATVPQFVGATSKKDRFSLVEHPDPIATEKACKNPAELDGMREAHRLDGVAMARFLHWFDNNAPTGQLTEIDIASALEGFRRLEPSLFDISFDTISGAGPDGAIVHYRVTKETNRRLNPGELMLVDSGGQYLSGTTDITRTLFCQSASAEQKDRFTRVLKGMIAISMLCFPEGTNGAQIDILARLPLWQVGLNYNHGTGHGVGAGLAVHEGPAGIAPRYQVPLQAGMILSNEPGYYREGAYGIRTENLLHVTKSPETDGFLAFETLTLAPIDTRLINSEMLSPTETDWLNTYHARVLREIGPGLNKEVLNWLEQATSAI